MQLSPAELSALQIRRLAFELGLSDLRVQGALLVVSAPYQVPKLAVCPCCGYPTLEWRGRFDGCHVCGWEDDGQDDPRADEVFGGPNSDYSLTEARRNFIDHRTQYRPSDEDHFERVAQTRAVRQRIIDAYDALLPVVQPRSFIGALPEIARLETEYAEAAYGPRRKSRRSAESDARLRQHRDWEAWNAIASRGLPRVSRFDGPPAMRAEWKRVFAYFVRTVRSRLDAIAAQRGVRFPEPKEYAQLVDWTGEDERSVELVHYHTSAKAAIVFYPSPENQDTRYFSFTDPADADTAAELIAEYLTVPRRYLPLSVSPGRAIT